MKAEEQLLARLRMEIAARVRNMVVEPSSSATHLVLRLGDDDCSVVGIRVDDPERPSFAVSYTRLQSTSKGDRVLSEVSMSGVLEPGLEWIIGKIARHGYVPPEFD